MTPLASRNPAFLNREISWLEFNARVLHEAEDERTPLLERLKFLAIYASNLDEFYMVRVAGLRRQLSAGVTHAHSDGLTPAEQLELIDARVRLLNARARTCLHDVLLPRLAAIGVRLLAPSELSPEESARIEAFFDEQVFPVLTPLAVDPGHPFPYISNLSLSLAVELRDPERGSVHFARVKVPKSLPRWVPTGRLHGFVPLEVVIRSRLDALFPGMEILGCHVFRLTRYSDLDISRTEEPEDLLATIEEQLFQRRFGEVVRLEVETGMPLHLRELLLDELRASEAPEMAPLSAREVHEPGPLLDVSDLLSMSSLDLPEHRDPPLIAVVPPELRDTTRSIFDVIREHEILVHHPFDSFGASVETFIESAARDEQVLAIKLTLYRTSGDGAIVQALTEAAQRGKQVAVLVELQARFDEVNNIAWARTLESFGVHVVYGLPGLKTHTKTALVVRRDPDGIRRYVHIGTGNYNTRTARIYTDLGIITCDEKMRRHQRPLQFTDGVLAPARVPPPARRAGEHARIDPRAHRPGDGARRRGPTRPHHREDERDRGRRMHRGALPRVGGRRADRPHHPRHLLPVPGRAGTLREHPRQQHHRTVPRAFAPLDVQQRRRP